VGITCSACRCRKGDKWWNGGAKLLAVLEDSARFGSELVVGKKSVTVRWLLDVSLIASLGL